MEIKHIYFTLVSLVFSINSFSQYLVPLEPSNEKFEIIYLADGKYASDSIWLKKIRDYWKATGINLRIYRSAVEQRNGSFNWNKHPYEVDNSIKQIANAGLNIYIRVSMAFLDKYWVDSVYTNDDFHIRSDGKRFLNRNDPIKRPILNLTSKKSRDDMLNFIQVLVDHLHTFPEETKNRIKVIVPTFSPDDETEFPFNTYDEETNSVINYMLTGFSNPEIEAFMIYLQSKYGSIKALNSSWNSGSAFSEFSSKQIQIKKYNWDGIKSDINSPDYYKYENGRKDFLDFRREELKRFIDDCSNIIRTAGFKFGVQFGSIYDNWIEFRGFYDPTPLLENVDQLITDDILEYYPNFSFSADYSRSLCKYWNWVNSGENKIFFSTEVNWPGYNNHSPETLIKYWAEQLRTFYKKGASSLFLAHWGTIGSKDDIPEKIKSDALSPYKVWQDTLSEFRHKNVITVSTETALHLACEQVLHFRSEADRNDPRLESYSHNIAFIVGKVEGRNIYEFPLNRFVSIPSSGENNYYQGKGDFVTNYMLKTSPSYLKSNYRKFYFTGTSDFIDKSVYIELK